MAGPSSQLGRLGAKVEAVDQKIDTLEQKIESLSIRLNIRLNVVIGLMLLKLSFLDVSNLEGTIIGMAVKAVLKCCR